MQKKTPKTKQPMISHRASNEFYQSTVGSVFRSARHTVHSLVSTQLSAWGTYWRISYFNVKDRPFYPVWILLWVGRARVRAHTNPLLIVSPLQRLCIIRDLKAVRYMSGSKFLGRIIISSFSWLQDVGGVQELGRCRCKLSLSPVHTRSQRVVIVLRPWLQTQPNILTCSAEKWMFYQSYLR